MKFLLAYLLAAAACFAGDMICSTDADMKKAGPEYREILERAKTALDLSKEDDRKVQEHIEQEMYSTAMIGVAQDYWRNTKLKKGDDWRKLFDSRKQTALAEVAGDAKLRESLEKAFTKLPEFGREAVILERVVKARFGNDEVWILLVHWEMVELVEREVATGKDVTLGHFFMIAVRIGDEKIVSRASCG